MKFRKSASDLLSSVREDHASSELVDHNRLDSKFDGGGEQKNDDHVLKDVSQVEAFVRTLILPCGALVTIK